MQYAAILMFLMFATTSGCALKDPLPDPAVSVTISGASPDTVVAIFASPPDLEGVDSLTTPGALTFSPGTEVTLQAPFSSNGRAFNSWRIGAGTRQATNPISLTLEEDTTVEVAFGAVRACITPLDSYCEPAPYTVHLSDCSVGNISAWEWDFGDGTIGTGPTISHEYTRAGTYTITLKVIGPLGSDTKTTSITVGAELPSTPMMPAGTLAFSTCAGTTWTFDWYNSSGAEGYLIECKEHYFNDAPFINCNYTVFSETTTQSLYSYRLPANLAQHCPSASTFTVYIRAYRTICGERRYSGHFSRNLTLTWCRN